MIKNEKYKMNVKISVVKRKTTEVRGNLARATLGGAFHESMIFNMKVTYESGEHANAGLVTYYLLAQPETPLSPCRFLQPKTTVVFFHT